MNKIEEAKNCFSVIIPLYNKIDYIERAINSVLAQTYQNFEIVVVNDGSTDKSETKLSLFTDKRIHLINQKNQGVSVARNNGALNAKYDFLAFLDADDIWNNAFLENINMLINTYPKAGVFGTNNYFEYPDGTVFYEKFNGLFGHDNFGIIKDYFALFAQIRKSPFSNSNLCIPAKIYTEFGGYKQDVKLTEDSDLWCRIAFKYDVAFTKTPLSTYYLALPGSTHLTFEPKDFEVVLTLKDALNRKVVKKEQIKSVKKLIAFQRLSLVKRSILTNHRLYALKKIFNFNLFYFYNISTIQCFVVLFIPQSVLTYFRKRNIHDV